MLRLPGGSELSASHEGTQGAGRKSMSGAVIDTGDKPSAQDSSDEEDQEEPEDDDDPELEVVDMVGLGFGMSCFLL